MYTQKVHDSFYRRCTRVTVVHRTARRRMVAVHAYLKPTVEADVVIVGAGIIGLLTAEQLLRRKMSVAVVERRQLCAGATGAGQGYIWMAHRQPNTVGWELAQASLPLWKEMLQQDPAFKASIEWQECGSLLLASTPSEAAELHERHALLTQHGVNAQFLDAAALRKLEVALRVPDAGAGLLAPQDAQINGRKTAATLLDKCKAHGSAFHLLFDEPISHITSSAGDIRVETGAHTLRSKHATILAAGAWSGEMLTGLTGGQYAKLLQPRRGHLLEVLPPPGMPPLKHGMMEMSYSKHYGATSSSAHESHTSSHSPFAVDITFTATASASGTLLLGSSREFSGYDNTASQQIIDAIMQRATQFLPALAAVKVAAGDASGVRVGLRPFAAGGLPMVGPVPGHPKLFVAAGHEGSGLCMGPATAQMLVEYVEGPAAARAHDHVWQELLPATRLLVAEL